MQRYAGSVNEADAISHEPNDTGNSRKSKYILKKNKPARYDGYGFSLVENARNRL